MPCSFLPFCLIVVVCFFVDCLLFVLLFLIVCYFEACAGNTAGVLLAPVPPHGSFTNWRVARVGAHTMLMVPVRM